MAKKKPALGAQKVNVHAALAAAKSSSVQSTEDDNKVVALSLRLPKAVHEQLRKISFDERVSIHSIVLSAIGAELASRREK